MTQLDLKVFQIVLSSSKHKYMMLRQEMESYTIIIGACAHNKDDNKHIEDT